MQNDALGDNVHEMLKPIFWVKCKKKKKFKMSSAEIFTQHAKHKLQCKMLVFSGERMCTILVNCLED